MNNKKQTIYIISPHLDDAIWSLGGLIAERKDWSTVVINVFSHSLFINDHLDTAINATKLRTAEDSNAAKHCRVSKTINLEYCEAVHRGIPLSGLNDSMYVSPEYLVGVISRQLSEIIPENAVVLFPSAFGNNIDHIMARDCREHLSDRHMYYYEDMPYAARETNVGEANEYLQARGYARHAYMVNESTTQTHMILYDMYKTQRKQHHKEQITSHLNTKGYGIWKQQTQKHL